MTRVLIIAAVFPPYNDSAAARPFHFVKHLPEFGYNPLVVSQRDFLPFSPSDADLLKELNGCRVMHVGPLGSGACGRRLLSPVDRLAHSLTGHDRLGTDGFRAVLKLVLGAKEWKSLAIMTSLKLFRRPGFDLIWATGPPWDALKVGYVVSMATGRPFVADLRDPWTYGVLWTPQVQKCAEAYRRWERRVLRKASRIVFTSPLTTEIMRGRSDKAVAERMTTITNGFADGPRDAMPRAKNKKCVFSYVGSLMRQHRWPGILFEGFRLACEDPSLRAEVRLKCIGRMSGYERDVSRYEIEDVVECVGQVSSKESLEFMRASDVLVLLQTISGEGRDVIGGKAYEYLSARRPILAIVPKDGGDAWLVSSTGAGVVVGIEDPVDIARGIRDLWRLWRSGKIAEAYVPRDIDRFNRRNLAKDLAGLFDDLLDRRRGSRCRRNLQESASGPAEQGTLPPDESVSHLTLHAPSWSAFD